MRHWGLVALLGLVVLGTSGCGSKGAVPARLATDEPALTTSEAPNVEIVHPGVIVRMNAAALGRKPYLRVDVVIQYAPGATGDAATKSAQLATATRLARLASPEGKAIIMKGLMRDLPTAEEIEADQILHMDAAAKAIKDVLIEEGFPSPLRVLFSSWVIQG